MSLQTKDLSVEGETAFYSYRGKGDKRGRRELPRPAFEAIAASLRDAGKDLAEMEPEESLWQAAARPSGVVSHTFYLRFCRYLRAARLAPSGVHITRHTAAKLRREAGESVEAVSAFLDHSSLAVTTVYLRRLEGDKDTSWSRVAEAIGPDVVGRSVHHRGWEGGISLGFWRGSPLSASQPRATAVMATPMTR